LTITGRLTLKAYSLSVVYSCAWSRQSWSRGTKAGPQSPSGIPIGYRRRRCRAGAPPVFVLRAFYFGRRLPGRRLPPSSSTPPISPGTADRIRTPPPSPPRQANLRTQQQRRRSVSTRPPRAARPPSAFFALAAPGGRVSLCRRYAHLSPSSARGVPPPKY
jgi:hypothetical protein